MIRTLKKSILKELVRVFFLSRSQFQSNKHLCLHLYGYYYLKHVYILRVVLTGGTNLTISARRLASSAMRLMSLKAPRSVNIFVSADCRPCRVRCSVAHAASRASLPKSF